MNDEVYLTTIDLAERWKMSPDTLSNWRIKKIGPHYLKVGAGRNTKVLYKLIDVIQFENENTRKTK